MTEKLLTCLLRAGAKASKIAYQCRAEKALFSILVQEKESTHRLDFKTLADVFIQQVVKSEISLQCPEIQNRVYGEENNQFTNTLGETITVEVKSTENETTSLLTKVLDGNEKAARLFAATAHNEIKPIEIDKEKQFKLSKCSIDVNELGIWIDPIDATSQYVKGKEGTESPQTHVHSFGLQCVTVLIGVYNIITGLPVIGVIFQPFHSKIDGVWQSKHFWGLCCDDVCVNNVEAIFQENMQRRSKDPLPLVMASPSDKHLCELLKKQPTLELCTASGAGYKCLCVIEGLVDAYLYSIGACYNWDTCAPHAILLSLGGGIASFRDILKDTKDATCKPQLLYQNPNSNGSAWVHLDGTVAYTKTEKSLKCLSEVQCLQSMF